MKSQIKDVVHALKFNGSASPLNRSSLVAKWTPRALSTFMTIKNQAQQYLREQGEQANKVSIPSASLRMRLQLTVESLITTSGFLSLSNSDLSYQPKQKSFAVYNDTKQTEVAINRAIESWLEIELTRFIERYHVSDSLREELYDLLDEADLYKLGREQYQLFPWSSSNNGTATPQHRELGYSVSANEIAQLLEGVTLFEGLPKVSRVIGGGELGSNRAELMTPIINATNEGAFSMVCSISIETLPTVSYPLICIDIHRRRWIKELSSRYTPSLSTSGYFFDKSCHKAYKFKVEKVKSGSNWVWEADSGWDALSHNHTIPLTNDANKILQLSSRHDLNVSIAFVNGLEGADEKGQHAIGTGCTETDRVHVFNKVSDTLSEYGFERFSTFEIIANPRRKFQNTKSLDWYSLSSVIANSRYINELMGNTSLIANGNEQDICDAIIAQWADTIEIEQIDKDNKSKTVSTLGKVDNFLSITHSLAASAASPSTNKITLIFITQDVSQQPLVKTIATKLFGDSVDIVTAALPAQTHGAKANLPLATETKSVRFFERSAIWEKTIDKITANISNPALCLIQAAKFYGDTVDDEVNKPAAKIAFTSKAGIPVQYLMPVNERLKSKKKQSTDYIHRIQSALLDLFFGHLGLIPNISQSVQNTFPLHTPNYLYGVRVLSVNDKTFIKGKNEIAVASRVNTKTGIPEIKLGYAEASFCVSQWMTFPKAISHITQRFNTKLSLKTGSNFTNRGKNFHKFFAQILDEANNQHGVLFVDSAQCRGLCTWLTDAGVEQGDGKDLVANWPNLRLIRVREQAPQIMVEKYAGPYDAHTSCQRLLKVLDSSVPVYWSLGLPLTQHKRGKSVYRNTTLSGNEGKNHHLALHKNNTPTPNAVEFTLLNTPAHDCANDIARFATELRTGVLQAHLQRWIQLPAPLFIMNKLLEYLRL